MLIFRINKVSRMEVNKIKTRFWNVRGVLHKRQDDMQRMFLPAVTSYSSCHEFLSRVLDGRKL